MSSEKIEKAVVLLSGGLDSATSLAVAVDSGFECYALSFHYGQRNAPEVKAASRVSQSMGVKQHQIVELPMNWIGGSALTADIPVPKAKAAHEESSTKTTKLAPREIPITYVPARNSVFLTIAAAWADALGAPHIFIGVNQIDYSGYPDCRPDFIQAMQTALRHGTRLENLQIHAPLMDLTKAQIIKLGTKFGVDYALTWSCYDPQPGELACGFCDTCNHRRRGFIEAGVDDPTRYAKSSH